MNYQKNLSAEISYKSMHGNLYTDFPNVKLLSPEFVKTTNKRKNSTVYKLESKPTIRIGKGDNKLKFKTINGDMYVRRK